jgi:MFS-type transporter involved in bile tolerance (Atg22 family)
MVRVSSPLKRTLYLVCMLTDFTAFVVVFAVSRGLAEAQAEPWYLGMVGAGWSVSAGVGSVLGGWLAHRFNGRVIKPLVRSAASSRLRHSFLIARGRSA